MTVQECVNAAKAGYPSLPDIGAPSTAVDIFNEVHNDILARCGIQTGTETITLVAGTKEYDLQITARFACTAVYVSSATDGDGTKLQSMSQEEFEARNGDYKFQASGTPTHYYISHKSDGTVQIGFHPTPDTATTGGYPNVTLRVGRGATLTAAGNLPLGVKNHAAWVAGVQAVWAKRKNLPEANQKKAEYNDELAELQAWRHNFQQESPFSGVPNNSWRRRRRA